MTRREATLWKRGIALGALAVIVACVASISLLHVKKSGNVGPKIALRPTPPMQAMRTPARPKGEAKRILPGPTTFTHHERVAKGTVLGKIEIPRLKVSTSVIEGTDERELSRGAGHVPSTAMPGPTGNVAIAAHRDKFFRALRFIQPNDEVIVDMHGKSYRYRVEDTTIVKPSDVAVLKQTAEPELTLITCYPFFFKGHAPKRFIVRASGEGELEASVSGPKPDHPPASPQQSGEQLSSPGWK